MWMNIIKRCEQNDKLSYTYYERARISECFNVRINVIKEWMYKRITNQDIKYVQGKLSVNKNSWTPEYGNVDNYEVRER